jgi:hypothetical protein
MCTALMVGRRARRHIGPADRKSSLRVDTPERHVARKRLSSPSSEVRSLVSMTCEAEAAWRDCTRGSGSV